MADTGDRFEILEKLGEGAVGVVYRARDHEVGEEVALKVISPEVAQIPRRLERLRQEVRLARKIRSPRVAAIHDLVELQDDTRAVTMQLVEGKTIQRHILDGVPVDYARFAAWGADIAEGLAAAHALSIVHRDLKPENVMVTPDDSAMVLDFGIARVFEAKPAQSRLTQEGTIVGTVLYMAPEQLLGRDSGPTTDLYALGLLLAELITGLVPFGGKDFSEILKRRAMTTEAYQLAEVDPGCPRPLALLVDQLLAIKVEERPSSATLVAEQLRSIARQSNRPLATRTDRIIRTPKADTAILPVSDPPAPASTTAAPAPGAPPRPSTTRDARVAVAAGLVACVAAMAWFKVTSAPDAPTAAPVVQPLRLDAQTTEGDEATRGTGGTTTTTRAAATKPDAGGAINAVDAGVAKRPPPVDTGSRKRRLPPAEEM